MSVGEVIEVGERARLGELPWVGMTGGSSPIAQETAELLKDRYAMCFTASTAQSAEEVAESMERRGISGLVSVCDLGGVGIGGWYEDMKKRCGDKVAALLHIAADPVVGAYDELKREGAEQAMEVNAYPVVDLVHLAGSDLAAARDRGEPGVLLTVGTLGGTPHLLPGQSAYGPSKAWVDMYVRGVHKDEQAAVAKGLIWSSLPWLRVLRAGAVDTDMFNANAPAEVQAKVKKLGLVIPPIEVAGALVMMMEGRVAPKEPIVSYTGGLVRLLNAMPPRSNKITGEPVLSRRSVRKFLKTYQG